MSRPATDHDRWPLPPALDAARRRLSLGGPYVTVYESPTLPSGRLDSSAHPMLIVHGIHPAASAADVLPLFDRCAPKRPVVALELPGFGSSTRGPIDWTPQLMAAAILRAVEHVRQLGLHNPVDLLAIDRSGEFAARAALSRPHWFRSLAMISPTGLEGERVEAFDADAGLERSFWRGIVDQAPMVDTVFRWAVTRATVRLMLGRLSGFDGLAPAFVDYALTSARLPGASHAPIAGLTGALRTPGVVELYARLPQPVWVGHGVRGLPRNFDALARIGPPSHWTVDVFGTGAWPHFEVPDLVVERYESFLDLLRVRALPWRAS